MEKKTWMKNYRSKFAQTPSSLLHKSDLQQDFWRKMSAIDANCFICALSDIKFTSSLVILIVSVAIRVIFFSALQACNAKNICQEFKKFKMARKKSGRF